MMAQLRDTEFDHDLVLVTFPPSARNTNEITFHAASVEMVRGSSSG
jgi:hypothetical protein